MANLKLDVGGNDLPELIANFDKLSAAQQKLVLGNSAVGKQYKKMGAAAKSAGRAGKKAGDDGGAAIGKMVTRLAAGAAGFLSISKGAQMVREELERIQGLQDSARTANAGFVQTLTNMQLNDPQLRNDPATAERYRQVSLEMGATLGEGGATRVAAGFATLRSKTFGAATDDERIQAMDEAVKQARLGGDAVDVGQISASIVLLAKSFRESGIAKGDEVQAAGSFLRELGGQFAGNAPDAAGQVPSMLGVVGKDSFGATEAEAFSTFAQYSGVTGASAEEASTASMRLLSRFNTRDVDVGGQKVELEGEGAYARMTNFMERLRAGEFGDRSQAVRQFSTRGKDQGFLLKAKIAELETGIDRFDTALGGGDLTGMDLEYALSSAPGFRQLEEVRQSAGKKDVSAIQDMLGVSISSSVKSTTDLAEGWGRNADLTGQRSLRRLGRRMFGDPADVRKGENRDLARDVLSSAGLTSIGGATLMELPEAIRNRGARQDLLARAENEGVESILPDIFAMQGADSVTLRDGLDRVEQAILRAGGVDGASIEAMNKAVIEGTKEGIKEATAELVEAMRAAQEAAAANKPAVVNDGGN